MKTSNDSVLVSESNIGSPVRLNIGWGWM